VNNSPIGIFDSGVGGLTVARAIMDQLPNEELIYVADTARGPYGPRTIAEVRAFALEIMDFLVAQNVKMIVIACNSASAAVLRDARERYSIPVVEVIQPASRRALSLTRNNRIGVIGTQATITSGAYSDALSAASDIQLTAQACPKFVSYVESGVTTGTELSSVATEYLSSIKAAEVDTLILGCTHYPLLAGVLQYVLGDDVQLVSSAEETAKDVYRGLVDQQLLRDTPSTPVSKFYTTGDAVGFAELGKRILGISLNPTLTDLKTK
jgi:glutamate racemase